jgi:hypothetical protein
MVMGRLQVFAPESCLKMANIAEPPIDLLLRLACDQHYPKSLGSVHFSAGILTQVLLQH